MISLTNPTLEQQAILAIETQLGDWFANSQLGSQLHRLHQMKNSCENYLKLRQSALNAVAHLPVEVETQMLGQEFHYSIKEKMEEAQ